MTILIRFLLAGVAALLLSLAVQSGPASAQMMPGTGTSESSAPATPVVPEDLTPAQVDDLVARMSDDQVRALLLDRLDAVAEERAAASAPPESIFKRISTLAATMFASWVDVVMKVPALFAKEVQAFSNFFTTFGGAGLLSLFGFTALALALGFGAEKITEFATRRWQGKQTSQSGDDLMSAVSFLFRRFCRELLGLVVFYTVLTFVGRRILDEQELAFAAPFVLYLIWVPRIGAAVSRFVLAPHRSDLRLVNVNDHWATYLYRNLIGLFILIGFLLFILTFNALNGVPAADTRIGFWLNSGIHIYIAMIAWNAREGLTQMMLGTDPDRTEFDVWVSNAFPYFAITVSAATWLAVEAMTAIGNPDTMQHLLQGAHYVTMFWLLVAPALDTLIRGLVRHLLPPMIGEGPVAEQAYKATKRSYIRIGRVLAGIFIVLQIAETWDIDLRNMAAVGVGGDFGSALIEFLVIVAIGYILNEVVSLWINRRLAKEMTAAATQDEEAGEGGGAGGSRLATVLPLLRVSAQAAIAVIFALLALGALGIDITPLLAGAGIIGLAIGFGAQKLVTDIVSGIFFLIDDAFRVGEYVDVGGTTGTVEKISIRSMQLRHHRGPVHTIPYGEIPKLTNYSRDWVIMKLKFTVPFDTDPNKVKKIFKKIGAEMMEDPLHKDGFLQPFKSQGVFDIDDVGMIIRGKFMAKPGTQFTIRKEIYNRVKKEFNDNGIDFARREVRVAIPGLEDAEHLTDEQKSAVGAAAAQAAQQQQEGQQ